MSFDKTAQESVINYSQLICDETAKQVNSFLAARNFKKNHLTVSKIAERLSEQTGLNEQIVKSIVTLYVQERKDVQVVVGRYGGIRPVGLKNTTESSDNNDKNEDCQSEETSTL